jgi:predicted solute-binding protein
MTRAGVELGDLPRRLDRIRRNNRGRLDEIAATHAEAGGWPPDLAASYLGRNLRYRLGTSELEAISEFWSLACRHGIIGDLRPMKLYKGRG